MENSMLLYRGLKEWSSDGGSLCVQSIKKEKFFGKLNVIDLIVILLIIVVLALVGYKLVFSNGAMSGGGQKIVYTVKVEGSSRRSTSLSRKACPASLCPPMKCWMPTSPQ